MTEFLIRTSDLKKVYGENQALAPLDWTVSSGSITGVLGPNGAGKTTLAKLILGVTWPTGGTVEVLGRDVASDPSWVRAEVGFVPEDKLLYDEISVESFLRFYGSFFPRWDQGAAQRLLEIWEIPNELRIKQLSKGNRAKLVLGAVLCRDPKLLLLDEPTIDLDPASAEEVLSFIAQWAAEGERAVVITTHRLEEVERICDQLLLLLGGEVVLRGDLDDLRENWKWVRASGELPAEGKLRGLSGVRGVEGGPGWAALLVEGTAQDVLRELRGLGASDVRVEGVTLREIYLSLTEYEGSRLDAALEGLV
jgi:ABC-2 type transport system ATP-binding protein